jgi:phage terminase small subunit
MAKNRYANVLDTKAAALPEAKRQQTNRPPLAEKRLTRRQELFVRELVAKDGQITMREAAINAGYPEKSAHVRASELTNPRISPHVCRAIREYRQELDQKYGVEYQRHLRDLQIIRDLTHDAGAEDAGNRKRARERLAEETDGHTGREAEDQETEGGELLAVFEESDEGQLS